MNARKFKTTLVGATLLLLALGLTYPLTAVVWSVYASALSEIQYLDSTILIQDHRGAPAGNAYVTIFELADGGPRKLSEGFADNVGTYKARLSLPRKLVYVNIPKEDEAENLAVESKEIYAVVNLWIVAHKVYEEPGRQVVEIGTLTLSVNPASMRHPLDYLQNKITLSRIESQARRVEDLKTLVGSSLQTTTSYSCQIPKHPYQEASWAYTTVLKFATWDNIEARFSYPKGSLIRVESRERYFIISSCGYSSWNSGGSTIVTLNHPFSLVNPVSGRKIYTLKINFTYYFIRYWPPYQSTVMVEKVYAADTSNDGAQIDFPPGGSSSWSGTLPSWTSYYLTPQGIERQLDITGTDIGFSFSIGASVSFHGVGLSISVGVSKQPSPVASLYIRAGTWLDNYKVKTVSRDGSNLETYSNWVPP